MKFVLLNNNFKWFSDFVLLIFIFTRMYCLYYCFLRSTFRPRHLLNHVMGQIKIYTLKETGLLLITCQCFFYYRKTSISTLKVCCRLNCAICGRDEIFPRAGIWVSASTSIRISERHENYCSFPLLMIQTYIFRFIIILTLNNPYNMIVGEDQIHLYKIRLTV